jgi:hypothetical protein
MLDGQPILVSSFFEQFPLEIFKDTLRLLPEAYRSAHEACFCAFPKAQARDLFPYQLRTTIETRLIELAKKYKSNGVTYITAKNKRKNCHHVLVKSGNAQLTISAVKYPSQRVRVAEFRKNYSKGCPIQQSLFKFQNAEEESNGGETLYAIIKHCPKQSKIPEFIYLSFPDHSCKNEYTVDLYGLFPDFVPKLIAPEEEIAEPQFDFSSGLSFPEEAISEPEFELRRDIDDDSEQEAAGGQT